MNSQSNAAPQLKVLWQPEPAYRIFFRNLADVLLRGYEPPPSITSRPGPFWRDVFVYSGVAWWAMLESLLWHVVLVAAIWDVSLLQLRTPQFEARRGFRRERLTYYAPPKFPAALGRQGQIPPPPPKIASAMQSPLRVAKESAAAGSPKPPDLKLGHAALPKMAGAKPVLPAVPFAATSMRPRLVLPADALAAIAPPPSVASITGRQHQSLSMTVVAPPPGLGGTLSARHSTGGGSSATSPNVTVVAPAPSVNVLGRKIAGLGGSSQVVAPAPRLPGRAQSATSGGLSAAMIGSAGSSVVPPPPSLSQRGSLHGEEAGVLPGTKMSVVPPPPLIAGTQSGVANGRGSLIGGGGAMQVVQPAPSLAGIGGSANRPSAGGLTTAGLRVVAPAPSAGNLGGSISGRRTNLLAGNGAPVVPPSPSIERASLGDGAGNAFYGAGGRAVAPAPSARELGGSGGSMYSLGGGGAQVVGPPPSVEQAALGAGGRGSSLSGAGPGSGGAVVAPNTAGANGGGGSGGSGPSAALAETESSRPPTPPDLSPGPQTVPVRLVALALSLPSSSFFSNYEVFIAERQLARNQFELIKLVYVSLPYQRRLSDYPLSDARVYRLRVTRDPSCDESLLQMSWTETGAPSSDPRLSSDHGISADPPDPDRSNKLPCYRTTADDYRQAVSRGH